MMAIPGLYWTIFRLKLSEGSAVAVVGPSGSGKSTLLNLLGTLDFPTSGEVLFNGTATTSLSSEELVKLRNNSIGFIFQTHLLLPQLTVIENILLPVIPQDKINKGQHRKELTACLTLSVLLTKNTAFPVKCLLVNASVLQ